MNQATPNFAGTPPLAEAPKGALVLLGSLVKKYKLFSALSTAFFLYFAAIAIASAFVSTPAAQWFKINARVLFDVGKCIYGLFEGHHGVHEILLGFGGIAVGIFIAVLIEDEKREKEEQLHGKTTEIGDATKKLVRLQKVLNRRIQTNVRAISNYPALLTEIGNVINEATKKEGDLLIMNLTASFGYFMTFDSDRVLQLEHDELGVLHDMRRKKLNLETQAAYFARHMSLRSKQEENEEKLEKCAPQKVAALDGKVEYLTLSIDGDSPSAFVTNYLSPSLHDATVMEYDSTSQERFAIQELPQHMKLFLIPNHLIPFEQDSPPTRTSDNMKQAFIDHLVQNQDKKIEWLRNINVNVYTHKEIPFQLYIWLPKNQHELGRGVFMFVNQHTLARTNYLAAFATEHQEVLETFKAIFESVKNQSNGPSAATTS